MGPGSVEKSVATEVEIGGSACGGGRYCLRGVVFYRNERLIVANKRLNSIVSKNKNVNLRYGSLEPGQKVSTI